MRRFRIDPNAIGTILCTHLHGDHFGGLPFFILDAQLVSKRVRSLTVAGPAGTRERLLQALSCSIGSSPWCRTAAESTSGLSAWTAGDHTRGLNPATRRRRTAFWRSRTPIDTRFIPLPTQEPNGPFASVQHIVQDRIREGWGVSFVLRRSVRFVPENRAHCAPKPPVRDALSDSTKRGGLMFLSVNHW